MALKAYMRARRYGEIRTKRTLRGQLDLAPEQSSVQSVLTADRRRVNQTEPIDLLFVTSYDVGADAGAFQTIKRIKKRLI